MKRDIFDEEHLMFRDAVRRFVVQEVTLNGLAERLQESTKIPRVELTLEASAVLAGTILMASTMLGRPSCILRMSSAAIPCFFRKA